MDGTHDEPKARTVLPRAVFFDVGDTLLDTSAMLDSALYTALVPLDPSRTIEEVRAAVARSGEALPVRQPPFHEVRANSNWWIDRYRRIGTELGLSGDPLMRFVATVAEGHFNGDALHVVPDAPAALSRLAARGIPLGVISNWDDTLEPILEKKGLHRFFRVFVASTLLRRAKPDREIFERALSLMGVEASDAWHVGDDATADAQGAVRAGLRAALLDPYDLYPKLSLSGVVRVRSLGEAVDAILGEGAQAPGPGRAG
jgi:putative hydrolase of the HAD superfamily